MGPDITPAERTSQATPFAEDFLQVLSGILTQKQGAQTVGPQQRTGGLSAISEATGVRDQTAGLIEALTARHNKQTERGLASITEKFAAGGNRMSTSMAKVGGQFQEDQNRQLAQMIGGIENDQAKRETDSLMQLLQVLSGNAAGGIVPSENIVSPGWGSQLLTGALEGGGRVLGAHMGKTSFG